MDSYQEQGFENRNDYLKSLSDEYGQETVQALSELLGPEEDFDGLITMLQYVEDRGFFG